MPKKKKYKIKYDTSKTSPKWSYHVYIKGFLFYFFDKDFYTLPEAVAYIKENKNKPTEREIHAQKRREVKEAMRELRGEIKSKDSGCLSLVDGKTDV